MLSAPPEFPPEWLSKAPHRPANDEVGSSSPEEFHSAVGRLTTAWELVEHALSMLFGAILRPQNAYAAAAPYGAVLGSGARCDMILSAAAVVLDQQPELLARTRELVSFARKLGALRNVAAHGMIMVDCGKYWASCPEYAPRQEGTYFLTPALYNTGKTEPFLKPKILYNANTISNTTDAIVTIQFNILDFCMRGIYQTTDQPSAPVWIVFKSAEDAANADAILPDGPPSRRI